MWPWRNSAWLSRARRARNSDDTPHALRKCGGALGCVPVLLPVACPPVPNHLVINNQFSSLDLAGVWPWRSSAWLSRARRTGNSDDTPHALRKCGGALGCLPVLLPVACPPVPNQLVKNNQFGSLGGMSTRFVLFTVNNGGFAMTETKPRCHFPKTSA